MKRLILPSLFILGIGGNIAAQGTTEFAAVLTGNTDAHGNGTFSLTTNLLAYDLELPYGYDQAQIRSPLPDVYSPVVFDLRLSFCDPPGPGPSLVGCFFKGCISLSEGHEPSTLLVTAIGLIGFTSRSWFNVLAARRLQHFNPTES